MKKLIVLLLACVMLLGLCACQGGQGNTDSTPAGTDSQTTASTEEEATQDEIPTEPEETSVDSAAANADKALAESCINKSVDELYALIGEPESSDYAPSCLNPGEGEDGNLYYDGFVVYTYREGDEETVIYVE